MSRPVLQPSPEHPITVEQSTEKVTVSLAGRTIATSDQALRLLEAGYPPVYYLPEGDVEPGVLTPSDTSSYCPYKGDASYFDVALTTESAQSAVVATDACWTYRVPYDAVAEIVGHVAFYPDKVDVQVV